MDPINSLGRMIELLRRRVSAAAPPERAPRPGGDGQGPPPAETRPTLEALKTTIARRIGALEADDPAHDSEATRVFVESVIAWEFGEQVLGDARYRDLVEHIDSQLQADPQVHARFAAMLRSLSIDA